MKTAVSIPDDVFEDAERLARRLKKSRSRLYSDALREYLARRGVEHVTETLDAVVSDVGAEPDPFVSAVTRRRLRRVEW
jgi:metal-responsive CopG/Arc/MetJ family transcriptional regulator